MTTADLNEPGGTSYFISDEAADPGGLDLATIHRLPWSALNDEATEFSQLVAER